MNKRSGSKRVDILGVQVDAGGMEEVVGKLKGWWGKNQGLMVVLTPNTEQVVMCHDDLKQHKIPDRPAHNTRRAVEDDPSASSGRVGGLAGLTNEELALMECFKRSDLNICDSAGLVWADKVLSRRLGREQRLKERVAGVDVAEKLVVEAVKDGKNVFLLGGRGDIAKKAAGNLEKRFKNQSSEFRNHNSVMRSNFAGFGGAENVSEETDDEYADTLKRIKKHKTKLLFVGFGAPRQERWVTMHRDDLEHAGVQVVMVVGQGIDVMAGVVKRAPKQWQKIGLEWLWRLIHEPWRWRRQLRLVKFMRMVINSRS